MTVHPYNVTGESWQVSLRATDDFSAWRDHARALFLAAIPPERVVWKAEAHDADDLFAVATRDIHQMPPPAPNASVPSVPRTFIAQAQSAALHSDNGRFALLYRLLWRLQDVPNLMEDRTDRDVRHLDNLFRGVRRDIHKMRAFVRFRLVEDREQTAHYVAWFEPEHHILRANAAFFVNRFTAMHWSILTPRGSLHWDGEVLREGPSAQRGDAPVSDAAEELWKKYYSSIFNPARLKVSAMLKEMPRRYWKNLPEATLIPELIEGAQARESAMVDKGASRFTDERPDSLAAIASGIASCRRCPIGCTDARAVAGEGAADATLMIVGEQPGDTEEQLGRPFIGPAGKVLRSHLASAGIEIKQAWLTNAVKHFKFVRQGKRRLHQNPSAREIDTCRWWLESERELIRPRRILALGASAARGILGRTINVQRMRGQPLPLDDGTELWITAHPSYLLRLEGQARVAEEQRFARDLALLANAGGR